MENELFREVKEQWKIIAQEAIPPAPELKLAFYKKMLSLFQVGEFYYFTFLPGNYQIEYVSPNISSVLGYSSMEFNIDMMMQIIHPDDLPGFIEFEKKVVEFKTHLNPDKIMKYKSQYNYRIRKKDGKYIPILQQSTTIQTNENGAALRNFIIHTNISTLRPSPEMSLSFIGMEDEPSYYNVLGGKKKLKSARPLFTKREKEILILLSERKTSNEIAEQLFISSETVNTHRKNIHSKANTHTVLELIVKSMEEGWI